MVDIDYRTYDRDIVYTGIDLWYKYPQAVPHCQHSWHISNITNCCWAWICRIFITDV